jgi:hypothetical protein
MNPDFNELERTWIAAVQRQDKNFLNGLLDEAFVCTAWSSAGDLTTRDEYLASVRCRLQCNCFFGERSWQASFLITDVWIRRGSAWKAVSRHASVPLGDWPALLSKLPGARTERKMRTRAESA